MKFLVLVSILSCAALGQAPPPLPPESTPKDVRDFIIGAADALTNKDARGFLDRFDGKMPGYQMLDYYVEGLLAHDQVLTVIEIVSDTGDEQERTMQFDWLLTVDSNRPQRQIVKVKLEKGKKWKITSLDPIDFFKPPPS